MRAQYRACQGTGAGARENFHGREAHAEVRAERYAELDREKRVDAVVTKRALGVDPIGGRAKYRGGAFADGSIEDVEVPGRFDVLQHGREAAGRTLAARGLQVAPAGTRRQAQTGKKLPPIAVEDGNVG